MLMLINLVPNLSMCTGGAEGSSFILHMAGLDTTVDSTGKNATMKISVHNVTLWQSCLEGLPFSPERPRHHEIMQIILVTITSGTESNCLPQRPVQQKESTAGVFLSKWFCQLEIVLLLFHCIERVFTSENHLKTYNISTKPAIYSQRSHEVEYLT